MVWTRFAAHLLDAHLPHAVIDRLQRQRQRGAALSGLAGRRHPRHHPEQAGRRRPAGTLRSDPRGAGEQRRALPLRSHGGRRPAGDLHPARPARHRRRTAGHRGHLLGHAGLAVQHVRRQQAVLDAGARGACAGLHRTRPARRPVRHRRGAQAGDPGARDPACALSLDDVQVESLVPDALRGADRDAFMAGLDDAGRADAGAAGRRPRQGLRAALCRPVGARWPGVALRCASCPPTMPSPTCA